MRMAAGPCPSRSRRCRELAESGIAFIEQPVRADDLDGLREVRALGVPLIADESVYSPADVLRVGRAGAADIVSVYVGKSSGLERAVESARLAGELGMDVVIGANGEMGIGAAAQLHVACACERISSIPHGIIGHHFYEDDASLADPARDRRPRRAAARRAPGSVSSRATRSDGASPREPRRAGLPLPGGARARRAGRAGRSRCSGSAATRSASRSPTTAGRRVFPRHRRVSVLTRTTALHRARRRRATARSCRRERRRLRCTASARRATAPGSAFAPGSSACTTTRSRQRTRRPPRGCSTARRPVTASARPRRRRSSTWPRSRPTSPRSSAGGGRPGGGVLSRLGAVVHADARARAAHRRGEAPLGAVLVPSLRCACPHRAEGARAAHRRAPPAQCTRRAASLRVFASGPPEQAALQGVSPDSVASADALLYGCGPLRGDELLARFDGPARARRPPGHGLDELDARAHRPRGRRRAASRRPEPKGSRSTTSRSSRRPASRRSARRPPHSGRRCRRDGDRRSRHDRRRAVTRRCPSSSCSRRWTRSGSTARSSRRRRASSRCGTARETS